MRKIFNVLHDNRIEAEINLRWYAGNGYYRISVSGTGANANEAEANAMLLLGQARAKLNTCVPNRVSETEGTAEG